ncbi:YdcF family protein [Streptomyces sp. NPDC004031]
MLSFVPAMLCLLVFGVSVLQERRRFSNAVLLGLGAALAAGAMLYELRVTHPVLGRDAGVAAIVLVALGIVTLSGFLTSNGVVMVRKEGPSLANSLSLLSGVALAALLVLTAVTLVVRSRVLAVVTGTVLALAGYVAFLFLCFVAYTFVYSRLRPRRRADYVVVLGAGLANGSEVTPLLAGRLERAREVHGRLLRRGRRPIVLTSGGQGRDEKLPESHTMADYLEARGVPRDLIEREDRSTTTEENLRFSRAIMERAKPGYRCVIVTNDYHTFRAAMIARREGVRGQVVGCPTSRYFLPSATIREFVAVLVTYWRTNLAFCLLALLGGLSIWWLG